MNLRMFTGFFAALLLLAAVGYFSWRHELQRRAAQEWVDHTHRVIVGISDLLLSFDDAENNQRAFLLSGDAGFLAPYYSAKTAITNKVAHLRDLTSDNPQQQRLLNQLQPLVEKRFELLDSRIQLRRHQGISAVQGTEPLQEGHDTMEQIRGMAEKMRDNELVLLTIRTENASATSRRTTISLICGTFISVLLLALIFLALIRENATRRRSQDALQKSESQFRSLVEGVREYAIFMLDPEGRVITWTPAAQRLKGYTADEILHQHFSKFYQEEDKKAGKPETELEIARSEGRVEDEGWRVRKDGSRFWANVIITALRDEHGELFGFSKITRDMSDRKEAEEKLRESSEELRRSNVELEQFAYVASHDLQEPLRAISGCVQILQQRYKGKLDERADELIKHSVEGVTRMQTLINDLLAYSRVGTKGAEFEEVDANKAVKAALINLDTASKESGAIISIQSLPVVNADASQLVQLFQNLIGNALKYRGDDPPRIEVAAESRDDEWQFHVRDNGIGIESQYYERIFRLFQRLHTRRDYSGTGIGLAICKKIVERHGGRIWVESTPGKGSTFFFTLLKT